MDRRAFIGTLAAVMCGSGCARSDWIERTLVTVDVTGVWSGTCNNGLYNTELWMELKQEGSRVTGNLTPTGFIHGVLQDVSGPVEGTVSGDRFEFKRVGGSLVGEMTVDGDVMVGRLHGRTGPGQSSLRRMASR
jgi:hypothetical protein